MPALDGAAPGRREARPLPARASPGGSVRPEGRGTGPQRPAAPRCGPEARGAARGARDRPGAAGPGPACLPMEAGQDAAAADRSAPAAGRSCPAAARPGPRPLGRAVGRLRRRPRRPLAADFRSAGRGSRRPAVGPAAERDAGRHRDGARAGAQDASVSPWLGRAFCDRVPTLRAGGRTGGPEGWRAPRARAEWRRPPPAGPGEPSTGPRARRGAGDGIGRSWHGAAAGRVLSTGSADRHLVLLGRPLGTEPAAGPSPGAIGTGRASVAPTETGAPRGRPPCGRPAGLGHLVDRGLPCVDGGRERPARRRVGDVEAGAPNRPHRISDRLRARPARPGRPEQGAGRAPPPGGTGRMAARRARSADRSCGAGPGAGSRGADAAIAMAQGIAERPRLRTAGRATAPPAAAGIGGAPRGGRCPEGVGRPVPWRRRLGPRRREARAAGAPEPELPAVASGSRAGTPALPAAALGSAAQEPPRGR